MDELASEYLRKAEHDFQIALRLADRADEVSFDAICTHAHQSVEKFLKSLLCVHHKDPPRHHDLRRLYRLAVAASPELAACSTALHAFAQYGPALRYPGVWAAAEDARRAVDFARTVRAAVYGVLALPLPFPE